MFSTLSATSSYQLLSKGAPAGSLNPLYYYTFNSSTISGTTVNVDSTNSTNTQTLTLNSTSGTWTTCKEGDRSFTNGNKLYWAENISGLSIPTSAGITTCFWFYIINNGGSGNQVIFSQGTGTTSKIYIFCSAVASNLMVLSIQNNTGNNVWAETLDLGVWKHFAYTYTGTTLKCYINGTLKSFTSTSVPSLASETWTSMSVGRDVSQGAPGNIYGPGYTAIDCVRVYNRVLTQAEIQAIYTAGN